MNAGSTLVSANSPIAGNVSAGSGWVTPIPSGTPSRKPSATPPIIHSGDGASAIVSVPIASWTTMTTQPATNIGTSVAKR